MATITKELIAKNASCNGIVGLLNQGSLYPTGHLSIFTYDTTRITWHELSTPAFGDSSDATAYANPIADATALYDGTAYNFSFEDRDGSAIWNGLCSLNGGSGALQLESLFFPADSTVIISSARYMVP